MGDLIDRDVLLGKLDDHCGDLNLGDNKEFAKLVHYIQRQPAVDAVPVVHGKWLDLCRGKMRVCSFCKHDFDNTCNDIDAEWTFCPHCGAKMDEKED